MSEETKHPRSNEWFNQLRPEVVDLVGQITEAVTAGKRHILIKAQVKSGKKDIVESLSRSIGGEHLTYATALNRKDVKNQKEELELYNITTRVINKDDECEAAIGDLTRRSRIGRVWLCYDECDYGSGETQKMAPLFREFLNADAVIKIYFSATAQETEVSALKDRHDYMMLTFVPPQTYRGAQYFLDKELVFEPSPFFEVDEDGNLDITGHGETVIQESITPQRHIGVVRLAGNTVPLKDMKKKIIKQQLEGRLNEIVSNGRPWEIVPVDASDSHDWEDRKTRRAYITDDEMNYLFVIKQTCTRGTDLKGWHSTLAFWHDTRRHDGNARPNTLIQAMLRPAHYGPPQAIRLYVSMEVIELAASDNMDAYLKARGKPPARTKISTERKKGNISPSSFATITEAKTWWAQICNGITKISSYTVSAENTFQYRGIARPIQNEAATREASDIYQGIKGTAGSARIMPVFANASSTANTNVIRYIVIYERTNPTAAVMPLTSAKSMYNVE
jgi:hypothetical protein